ncbi:MAG: type II secretion system GspH family protein [Holosporales bacterium]|jgi:prepilin-type N-terminal cleavage/methylation domain-containing protein|nr:type II secretion system GspH family protein [Holosporales bacterium]
MPKTKVNFQGFSLIEVSIALIVIGIIASTEMAQFNMFKKMYAVQKTQVNIEFVLRAIAAYCINSDGKLPFPSNQASNIGIQDESMKNAFGFIPFKSLGIMEKFAKNGRGQWLLYKMNPFFGHVASSPQYKNLGVADFFSEIPGDKVAILIKEQNDGDNKGGIIVWYGEKSFIANFMNNKIIREPDSTTGISTGAF